MESVGVGCNVKVGMAMAMVVRVNQSTNVRQEYLLDHVSELLIAVGKGISVMKRHSMIPFDDRIFQC